MNILMEKDDTEIIILDSQGINYNSYDKVCKVVNKEKDNKTEEQPEISILSEPTKEESGV